MKNVFKIFGIIALVAIIGFSFTSCGDSDGGGNNPVMRTVTFDANGGTVEGAATKTVQVENGKKVMLPTDPVYGSKIFWGWFDSKTEPYGNRFTETTPVTEDKTVYARWGDTERPQQFDVTFNANGGKFTDGGTTLVIQVYQGEKVTPPYATRNDGCYMVSGWYSKADGTGMAFNKDTQVTADITVYAQWKPPEEMPDKDRWNKWVASDSTATLNYSVDDDGVCTITVGGRAQPNNETDGWGRWKVIASYVRTAKAGKSYVYTFEAWTESGTRQLGFQYNTDDNSIYFSEQIPLTTERQTFTVYGWPLSEGAYNDVEFHCADQLGTFYVKMLGIQEYTPGKLTITNFSGKPGLTQNMDVYGYTGEFLGMSGTTNLSFITIPDDEFIKVVQIKGNTINIPVWQNDPPTQFTGNTTIAAGELHLVQVNHTPNWEKWLGDDYYKSIVPITFINGNATINFGTQMQFERRNTP
jgi:uncharacterized repeat protein (TIGR02543 family)